MKAFAWITAMVCILYGVIACIIYQSKHADAVEASTQLQAIEARVEEIQRCQGKSLCYLTLVSYPINNQVVTAKVLGAHGKQGDRIAIWTKPKSPKGYESPSAFIEQSMAFFPFLFLPAVVLMFPLLFALMTKTTGKRSQEKTQ